MVDPGVYHASLPQLIENLSAISTVHRIWLFGSRARGDQEDRSDIDLAIEAPGVSPQEWSQLNDLIDQARTLLKVDLINLEQAPIALRDNILKEGICLYARSTPSPNP